MADANTELIRLWLETNFAEATAKGSDALKDLRSQVQGMGPEVAAAFDQMAGAEEKVVVEQAKLTQGMFDFQEPFQLQVETTKIVAGEYRNVRQALDELGAAIPPAAAALGGTALPAAEAGTGMATFGRSMMDVERATNALAGHSGLGRLGPIFERLITLTGGPAGMGFAIAGVAFALEGMVPKFLHWLNADRIKEAEAMAKAIEKQADAADRLAGRLSKEDEAKKSDIEDYIAETGGGAIREGISKAIRHDANATLTPDEIQSLKESDVGGEMGTHGMVRRRNEAIRAEQEKRITQQTNKVFTGIGDDKRSRLQAIDLAETHPEDFPRGFSDYLRSTEETTEEAKKAEADIEENDPDEQYSRRKKARVAQKNAEADEFNKDLEKKKKAKAEVAHGASERYAFEQKQEHEAEQEAKKHKAEVAHGAAERYAAEQKQEHEAAREAQKAAREAQKAARENTPMARQHQAQRTEKNQIEGYAQQLDRQNQAQGGRAASPEFMHQVAHHAAANVTMGADIASAVQLAVQQTQAKIAADFERSMRRQHQSSQSFYSP